MLCTQKYVSIKTSTDVKNVNFFGNTVMGYEAVDHEMDLTKVPHLTFLSSGGGMSSYN